MKAESMKIAGSYAFVGILGVSVSPGVHGDAAKFLALTPQSPIALPESEHSEQEPSADRQVHERQVTRISTGALDASIQVSGGGPFPLANITWSVPGTAITGTIMLKS